MIEIAFLADHLETVPTLVQWFRAQWPEYFSEFTPAEIAEDFYSETNRSGLDVRLVAFIDGELAGTVTLREFALTDLPEYSPGLGGLFVAERYRSQGVGTELIKAIMDLAREQGYKKIYTSTVTASGIVKRLGWNLVRWVSHDDEQLGIYSFEFEKNNPTQPFV
jgi:GNAT superfamily N-acetyltransferase